MVDTINVKDAAGATVSVATNDPIVTRLGEVQTTPTANTLLARTKAIQDKLVSGTLATAPQSAAHDVRVDFNRPADTTAYTAGDVVGGAKQFAAVGANAGAALITGLQLAINVASFTAGTPTTFRLHLYNVTPPSALADNAAWDLPSGDRASYLGYVDLPAIQDAGSTWYIEAANINKQIRLLGTDVWAYLVTNAGYTPSSAEGYSETLHTVEV